MCSGQVYYDVLAAREERKIEDVAIVRLEQMYPFPAGQVRDILARYPETAQVVWVQEEPRNMGAWRFVQEQMQPVLESTQRVLRYAGRAPSASPASGSLKRHQEELAELLEQSLLGRSEAVSGNQAQRPKRVAAASVVDRGARTLLLHAAFTPSKTQLAARWSYTFKQHGRIQEWKPKR